MGLFVGKSFVTSTEMVTWKILSYLYYDTAVLKWGGNQPTYICDCFLGFFLRIPALLDWFLHFILHLGNVTLQLLLLIDQACVLLLRIPQRNSGKGRKVMIRNITSLSTTAHQDLLIFACFGLQQHLGRETQICGLLCNLASDWGNIENTFKAVNI